MIVPCTAMQSPKLPSWASDIRHPLVLAAVAVLALNDHLLKGSGLLPAALTGKLSDVAGLFFFPIFLVAIARFAVRRDIGDRRVHALVAVAATGTVFTLLKLHAPFNAWVTSLWGVNVMDATDLWALPILPLSAAFMLRGAKAESGSSAPARRFFDLAALSAAAIASMATSKAPEPQAPSPSPRPLVAAEADGCASVAVAVCERSATLTYVVLEAAATGSRVCTVEVTNAAELTAVRTPADTRPAPMRVDPGGRATVALSFPRDGAPDGSEGTAIVHFDLRIGGTPRTLDATIACRPR